MPEKVCPLMKTFFGRTCPILYGDTMRSRRDINICYSYFSQNLFFLPSFLQCIIWINWINLYIYIYIYIYCLPECCMWRLYVSPSFFFLVVNYLHFLFALFIQASFFFYHYRLYHQLHHHFHFIFNNTASHWRIEQINSSSMVNPYTLITLGQT